jgi:membrane associated rhomboid family serine protease
MRKEQMAFILLVLGLAIGHYLYQQNALRVEVSESTIKSLNGVYYFNAHCAVGAERVETLPHGCFEKSDTHGYLSWHLKGIPDLVMLEKMASFRRAAKKILPLRFFKTAVNPNVAFWYLGVGSDMVTSSLGVPIHQVVPPNSGWRLSVHFKVSVTGRLSDANVVPDYKTSNIVSALFSTLRTGKPPGRTDSLQISAHSMAEKSPFLDDISHKPQTLILIFGCTLVWFYLWRTNKSFVDVAVGYDHIVLKLELWRVLTASISHTAFIHLLMNMVSLYGFGTIEMDLGPVLYFNYTCISVVTTMALVLLAQYGLTRYGYYERYVRPSMALGYSCVLFSWLVYSANQQSSYCPIPIFPSVFGNLCLPTWRLGSLPVNLAPFLLLGLVQLVVPRASFLGHFSGIVVGYMISWNLFRPVSIVGLIMFSVAMFGSVSIFTNNRDNRPVDNGGGRSYIRLAAVVKVLVGCGYVIVGSKELWMEMIVTNVFAAWALLVPVFRMAQQHREEVFLPWLQKGLRADILYNLYHEVVIFMNTRMEITEPTSLSSAVIFLVLSSSSVALNMWILRSIN